MQLDEELELSFKAGAEWAMENAYCDLDGVSLDRDIVDGYIEYINGNSKSDTDKAILEQDK